METNNNMNRELLKTVVENASIGKLTLGKLIKRSEDAAMRNVLAAQFAEYHKLLCDAENMLCQLDTPCGCAKRIPVLSALALNLSVDSTSSHMAEMVMQGSLMGIIDTKRRLREQNGADEQVRALAEKLAETEENNLRQMYEFV